jgi:hypothetical protein
MSSILRRGGEPRPAMRGALELEFCGTAQHDQAGGGQKWSPPPLSRGKIGKLQARYSMQ